MASLRGCARFANSVPRGDLDTYITTIIDVLENATPLKCHLECAGDPTCHSFTVHVDTGDCALWSKQGSAEEPLEVTPGSDTYICPRPSARGMPRRVAQATPSATRTSMALTAAPKRAPRDLASSPVPTPTLHPGSLLRAHPSSSASPLR